jgi:hypothetical protein
MRDISMNRRNTEDGERPRDAELQFQVDLCDLKPRPVALGSLDGIEVFIPEVRRKVSGRYFRSCSPPRFSPAAS